MSHMSTSNVYLSACEMVKFLLTSVLYWHWKGKNEFYMFPFEYDVVFTCCWLCLFSQPTVTTTPKATKNGKPGYDDTTLPLMEKNQGRCLCARVCDCDCFHLFRGLSPWDMVEKMKMSLLFTSIESGPHRNPVIHWKYETGPIVDFRYWQQKCYLSMAITSKPIGSYWSGTFSINLSN